MRTRPLLCALALLGVAACAPSAHPAASAWTQLLDAAAPGQWRSTGTDTFEVWICHVPADTTNVVYGGLPLRRVLTPAGVTALVAARVPHYFSTISHGTYHPVFVAGGEVTMTAADGPQDCVNAAIERAAPTMRAVLAVADAEQAPGQQGGFGAGGAPATAAAQMSVRVSHRYAYVGAADFSPQWGSDPPMDLVEHEIGHTLGWIHSSTDPGPPARYRSALDVMSDSAAPRDADPAVRDAPDTLGVDRVIAGWLPPAAVVVASGRAADATLSSSTGDARTRLLVLPVDASTFLTVELLTADGFDAHLTHDGIAVHRVTVDAGAPVTIDALTGSPPYTALLQRGESLDADGWRVTAGGDGAVTVARSGP